MRWGLAFAALFLFSAVTGGPWGVLQVALVLVGVFAVGVPVVKAVERR